jgi:hypothetical protein
VGLQASLPALEAILPIMGIVPVAGIVWIALWLVLCAGQNEAWAERLLRDQALSLGVPFEARTAEPLHPLGRRDAEQAERLT